MKTRHIMMLTGMLFLYLTEAGCTYREVGCFIERNNNKALPYQQHTPAEGLTIGICLNLCKEHKYFGLREGSICSCGNSSYDKYGEKGNCGKECTGNASQICGGWWRNSVYEIVLQMNTNPTTIEISAARSNNTTGNSTTQPSFTHRRNRTNIGVYAGSTVAVVIVCAVLATVAVVVLRRRRTQHCNGAANVYSEWPVNEGKTTPDQFETLDAGNFRMPVASATIPEQTKKPVSDSKEKRARTVEEQKEHVYSVAQPLDDDLVTVENELYTF